MTTRASLYSILISQMLSKVRRITALRDKTDDSLSDVTE